MCYKLERVQRRLHLRRGESECSLTKKDNGGRTPAALRHVAMAIKCLHIPQTPSATHGSPVLCLQFCGHKTSKKSPTCLAPASLSVEGSLQEGLTFHVSLPHSTSALECQFRGVW